MFMHVLGIRLSTFDDLLLVLRKNFKKKFCMSTQQEVDSKVNVTTLHVCLAEDFEHLRGEGKVYNVKILSKNNSYKSRS